MAEAQVIDVIYRLTGAVERVESALRAIELVVGAGHDEFVGLAIDDYERACERLASLELTRSIAMISAGFDPDLTASALIRSAVHTRELEAAVEQLADALERTSQARERTRAVVTSVAASKRARLEAALALTDHEESLAQAT